MSGRFKGYNEAGEDLLLQGLSVPSANKVLTSVPTKLLAWVAEFGRDIDDVCADTFVFFRERFLDSWGVLNLCFGTDGALLGRLSDSGVLCTSNRLKSTGLKSLAESFLTIAFATIMLLLSGLSILNFNGLL